MPPNSQLLAFVLIVQKVPLISLSHEPLMRSGCFHVLSNSSPCRAARPSGAGFPAPGAQRDSDFQSRLRVMDIDESETWAILGWDMTEGRSTEPQPPAKGTASSWL